MKNIPPHILWPGMILGLLTMSFITSGSILFASLSGDGLQVEEDYYARAMQWNEWQEVLARAQKMGWEFDVELVKSDEKVPSPQYHVRISVRDRETNPVEGLAGVVEMRRPFLASPVATSTLRSVDGQPGVYALDAAIEQPGVWDFVVRVRQGELDVVAEIREEVSS